MGTLLAIEDLVVNFYTYRGVVKALDGINLVINQGETVGLVGETGCGKSVTARAIIRLIDNPGRIEGGRILLEGLDLLSLPDPEMRKVRGRKISFIFQEPKKALDPTATVGAQMEEAIIMATGSTQEQARGLAGQILGKVGLADPRRVLQSYSFELSGGMAQRIMIGMAISGHPQLVIADEPTSALDVSIQAQVLKLLRQLSADFGSSLLLITHNLGIAAENCDRIAVMYAGRIVEIGPVEAVFGIPAHPYTVGLLEALPGEDKEKLVPIPGMVPDLVFPPPGCRFSNRCSFQSQACRQERPPVWQAGKGHLVSCYSPRLNRSRGTPIPTEAVHGG
jgi:oligopeptide/dipeptide ABC transporter ATP-binding protein